LNLQSINSLHSLLLHHSINKRDHKDNRAYPDQRAQ
jgi:hypothetical protein